MCAATVGSFKKQDSSLAKPLTPPRPPLDFVCKQCGSDAECDMSILAGAAGLSQRRDWHSPL